MPGIHRCGDEGLDHDSAKVTQADTGTFLQGMTSVVEQADIPLGLFPAFATSLVSWLTLP